MFSVEQSKFIEEIQAKLTLMRHPSGARIVHIENDDPENLFCLAFRTLPTRSDGVAHILEHTVLCGSEKYPVRDPFFSMIRRSLNTFMNAMTGDDMTFYPAASQVKKDFYNLLEVYCDAVFHPKLTEESFRQEGHRLALNEEGELIFKGIVFNEMKGAMASPDARAWEAVAKALYPDSPYHFNSGGDPTVIPDLTYQELRSFHKTYYHPSRCVFYFYGNLPIEEHIAFLEEKVLKGIEPLENLPPIPHQPRFKKPVQIQDTYPIPAEESTKEKAMVLFGWLTCEATDQLDILGLALLDELLMGTDASPLKLALLKSGLCKEGYAGLDDDTADVPFLIFLKGCEAKNADKIEELLFSTLKEIEIPQEMIDGAIHQLELERLEITGDSHPFGLSLFRRTVPLLMHGGNPEDGLHIHSLFKELRERFSVSELIEKYFLNNPHRARVVMEADPKRALEELQKEQEKLREIRKTVDLGTIHEPPPPPKENLDVLPKVTLADIPRETVDFPLTKQKNIYAHESFTNGLVYASLVFDLPEIKPEDLPYVRLLISLLPELGCGGRDYKAHLDYVQQHTGGVDAALGLHPQADDLTTFRPAFSVGGKALVRNAKHFFPLLKEMITSADFTDHARIQELLMQHLSSLENGLTSNALKYAINLAGSGMLPAAYISNAWYGLDYLNFIRNFNNIDKLQELQQTILGCGEPHLVISAEDTTPFARENYWGLFDLPSKPTTPWKPITNLPEVPSQGRIIASPVAFTCKMLKGISYTHPDAPALSLATRLFNHQTLHSEIREKGGAYGSGAANNLTSGGFYFYSYRDPHIENTLKAFDQAITNLFRMTEQEIEEAKLTVIQKLDSPISPGSRAEVSYSRLRDNRPVEMRQAFRDKLLSCTAQEIANAVGNHLKGQEATVVTFAGQELFDKEQLPLPLFKI